jgi:hypothetical protein
VDVYAEDLTRLPDDAALDDLAARATHAVTIGFAGVVAQTRFFRADSADVYRGRYRNMLSPEVPQLISYAVARRPGDIYFWVPGIASYRWDRCRIGKNQTAFLAEAVTNTAVFTSRENLIALHAAAVSDGRRAAAVIGSSEAGKTTTAIACVRRGLQLYSDEFCVVTPAGVIPFPRSLNVRAGGLALLAEDRPPPSPVDAWLSGNLGADRDDVGFADIFGAVRMPEPRPLEVVFAVRGRAERPAAEQIPAAAMLPHVKPWARLKARGIEEVHALLAMLQAARCYELTLGSPDATALLIRDVLAR